MKPNLAYICLGISVLMTTPQRSNAQWVQTNPLPGMAQTFAVNGTTLYTGTSNGVYRTNNNGVSWTADGLTNISVQAFVIKDSNFFAGTQNGIFLSTNNGTTWNAVDSGLNAKNLSLNVRVFVLSGNNIFAGTGGGVFLSNNNGISWTARNSGILGIGPGVNALVVKDTNIFAGTENGLFLSTNNGTNWTAIAAFKDLMNTYVYSLAVNVNNIFVGIGDSIYHSINNGMSWIGGGGDSGWPSTALISQVEALCFAVSGTDIFAGTNGGGVFLSNNNGLSWTMVGLMGSSVSALAVSGNNIFVGAWGDSVGVLRRPLSDFAGGTNPKRQLKMINWENLRVSSSNHTNSNAIIEFSMPHSDRVTVKIFNLSGHVMATLVDKNLESGSHSLNWDTKNITPGCYSVRIQVGEKCFVKSVPIFR